jgi:transcriptional regulator with XRE-family HTH domain
MSTLPKTAEMLRSARSEAGLSQPQLSELTGIAQANISRYERGQLNPNAATVDRIMSAIALHMGRTPSAQAVLHGSVGIIGRSQGKLGVVRDLMATPTPKEWFATGFVARGYATMVAGQEGSGKSTLTQTLCVAWAEGWEEAFGFHLPGKPLRVLIIDVENVMMQDEDTVDGSLVMERLQRFGLTEAGAENITAVGASGFDLDKDSDVLDAILQDAADEGMPYDVVVLDSFRSLWTSGSENTPDAGRVLAKVNRMAYKHSAAVLIIHHTNKAGAAYSGHTSIGSTVAAVWTFSRLIHKDAESGKKVQHPTARFLNPYKVRIAAEAKGRIVAVGARGITDTKSADEYDVTGYDVDPGDEDE